MYITMFIFMMSSQCLNFYCNSTSGKDKEMTECLELVIYSMYKMNIYFFL